MNAVVQPMPAAGRQMPMEVIVKGRIEHSSKFEGKFTTRCITPAADAYSRPQVVAIRSKQRLGQIGDEIVQPCKLGGYTRKAFRVTDKETGEITSVTPVDMTLDAID